VHGGSQREKESDYTGRSDDEQGLGVNIVRLHEKLLVLRIVFVDG
jgi:hypothetical protein